MGSEIQKTNQTSPLAVAADLIQQAEGKIDVDKLEALLKVQMQWEANEAKKAYVVAMAKFKENPPEILKDQTVSYGQTSYKHASLHNVTTKINTELSKHGLTASWVTSQDNGSIKVTCKITHIQGHSEETSLSAPPDDSGKKNSIQAIGSTVTYLQRYTIKSLTGLAEHDQDDDGIGRESKPKLEKPTEQQQKVIDAICDEILRTLPPNLKPDKDKVALIFFAKYNNYPKDIDKAENAAQWLIDLKRQNEWAIEQKVCEYSCEACDKEFDKKTDNGLCPHCLSNNFKEQKAVTDNDVQY